MTKRQDNGEGVVTEKRRGKGEGTLYQRPDGSWCAIVDHGVIDGKRRRTSLYGKTRKEVVEKLKALRLQEQQGMAVDRPKQTVAQFLNMWLEQVVAVRNKPRTQRSYQDMVRLHLIPHLGRHLLDKFADSHIQAMLNAMHSKGLSARAVKGHRMEALYRVALSLGLRRGEVLALRWDDVDFDKGTLRISGALQRVDGKLHRSTPKTEASAATLPLPDTLARVLRQHQAAQALVRANRKDWEEHGYVFPSERVTPMEPRNLVRHFKAALKRAELPKTIRFHDLRHSCATLLIAQGVHPRIVMEILRHANISVTMNTYAHVIPEQQRDATTKLAELFADTPSEEQKEEEKDVAT